MLVWGRGRGSRKESNPSSEPYIKEDFIHDDNEFSYSVFMRIMGISECRDLNIVTPFLNMPQRGSR